MVLGGLFLWVVVVLSDFRMFGKPKVGFRWHGHQNTDRPIHRLKTHVERRGAPCIDGHDVGVQFRDTDDGQKAIFYNANPSSSTLLLVAINNRENNEAL